MHHRWYDCVGGQVTGTLDFDVLQAFSAREVPDDRSRCACCPQPKNGDASAKSPRCFRGPPSPLTQNLNPISQKS